METFRSLFGKLLVFVYHCFDRIVIQGHLPLVTRKVPTVFSLHDVRCEYPITPKVLQQLTNAYLAWVDAYAGNHKIPVEKAKKGVSKEEHVRPYLERMERQNRYGVYFIFKSMEQGSCFKSLPPKYATDDPNYRIIRRDRKLYTHLYFYIRDEVLGPLAMCVGTYLPFLIFYYVNGHHYIENELKRAKVAYRKNDNAFLWVADPEALQAAADRLSEEVLRKRLDYWTFALGPKFSEKERARVPLDRDYSINQVEYCRNFIFQRNAPIHKIFERSCEMGLLNLTADKMTPTFGLTKHKRLRGKFYTMLEQIDHGHHVLRAYAKDAVARMYEKFSTFLRVELCVNRMKDLRLNKGLENLKRLRQILTAATDRFASFEAQALNVHGFSVIPAPGTASNRGQDQSTGDQDPGHSPAAADGGVTAPGHTDPRLAHGGDSSGDHHGLRSGPGHLLTDTTPLRHTETESARPIGTTGPTLLLSAHRQRGTRRSDVCAVPQAGMWPLGQQPV